MAQQIYILIHFLCPVSQNGVETFWLINVCWFFLLFFFFCFSLFLLVVVVENVPLDLSI